MWNEIVKNEIWLYENYFSETFFNKINTLFVLEKSLELTPDDSIRECFRSSEVNPTLYSYRVHHEDIRDYKDILESVYSPLSQFFGENYFSSQYKETLNPLQLFLKSFSPKSFYDVHCEPVFRYGEFAFIIFLDNCRGGDLVFPNESQLKAYLAENPEQNLGLEETMELLNKKNESARLIGPMRIQPSRNVGVLFRVGSIHWVEPTQETSILHRKCVTGWPFATSDLIEALDKHCKIKTHFDRETHS